MPKRVTSPRRKPKMPKKARMRKGSKEAKEWSKRMRELKQKKKEDVHRMAEANRAFAHFR